MSTALTQRLKRRGLLPSTRDKYQEILNAANHDDLLGWLGKKFHARTPLGTLLPARAAVKHFLISEHGYTEDELDRSVGSPEISSLTPAVGNILRSSRRIAPGACANSVNAPAQDRSSYLRNHWAQA